jgi:hypothetical protein
MPAHLYMYMQSAPRLERWILEILCCDSKGTRSSLHITEGRGDPLCWRNGKLKDLTDIGPSHADLEACASAFPLTGVPHLHENTPP